MMKGNGFQQLGISIGIGKRLGTIWKKYCNGKHVEENMVEEVAKGIAMGEDEDYIIAEEGEILE